MLDPSFTPLLTFTAPTIHRRLRDPTAKDSTSVASKASTELGSPPYTPPNTKEGISQRTSSIFYQRAAEPSNKAHSYLYASAENIERAQPRNHRASGLKALPYSHELSGGIHSRDSRQQDDRAKPGGAHYGGTKTPFAKAAAMAEETICYGSFNCEHSRPAVVRAAVNSTETERL